MGWEEAERSFRVKIGVYVKAPLMMLLDQIAHTN